VTPASGPGPDGLPAGARQSGPKMELVEACGDGSKVLKHGTVDEALTGQGG
jgi:hypothetical protein